ncbi:MAG: DNA translocase FtsK 4TM domain-containing protein, partial [bacterium]
MSAAAKEEVRVGLRQTWGGLLFAMSLVVLLSLLTYDWRDVSMFTAPRNEYVRNCFGLAGAWLSFCLFMVFGLSAYLVPLWCSLFGCMLVFRPGERVWPRLVWTLVFMVSLMVVMDLMVTSEA